MRLSRVSIVTCAAVCVVALLVVCTGEYNPFRDNANARVAATATFQNNGTVTIFSSETLDVVPAVGALIDSFRIDAASNRAFTDTTIRSIPAKVTAPWRFIISITDTGRAEITLRTYRHNGEVATEQFVVFGRSPLAQDTVSGELGSAVALATPSVADVDVEYHWDFGMGSVVSSVVPQTEGIVRIASLSGRGWLWVSGIHDTANESPRMLFAFRLDDRMSPEIQVVADSVDGDTIYTADTMSLMTVVITDQGTGGVVATINGSAFDAVSPPRYLKWIHGTGAAGAPVAVTVRADDAFGNSSIRMFRFIYSAALAGAGQPYLVRDIPAAGDTIVGRATFQIAGRLKNSYKAPGATVSAEVNGIEYPAMVPVADSNGTQAFWVAALSISSPVNTIVVRARSAGGDSLAGITFRVRLDANLLDSQPPSIFEISVNGKPAGGQTIPDSIANVSVLAFDGVSGIERITIAGSALTAVSSGQYSWQAAVPLVHYTTPQWGTTIAVSAVDRSGNRRDTSVVVYRNRPPVILAGPNHAGPIMMDSLYHDTLTIVDPDGDPVNISRGNGTPSGFVVSGTGGIEWPTAKSAPGPHTLSVVFSDAYLPSIQTKSWDVVVVDPFSTPVRLATMSKDFPRSMTAGVDTLRLQLQAVINTGMQPYHFSARLADGTELCDSAGHIVFIPRFPSDTGYTAMVMSVTDAGRRHDAITASIHVTGPNQPCSLALSFSQPLADSGILDLSRQTTPATITMTVHDPDPLDVERHTLFIRQGSMEAEAVLDSAGVAVLALDPDKSLLDRDTLRFIASDRGGLADTLYQVVQYYLPRLLVTVNATAGGGGAGVSSPVNEFPLLVRLTAANFDFTMCRDHGNGVSFVKLDRLTPLPFEIERWDSAAGLAEVWVKLDTVAGNDSTQFYLVRDRRSTLNLSNSSAVFSSTAFLGVWHLSESAAGYSGQPIYKDATANGRNGIDSTRGTGKLGVVGAGQEFGTTTSGNYDYIKLTSNARPTTALTFSAWVYTRNAGAYSQFVVADESPGGGGNYGYFVQSWDYDLVVNAMNGSVTTNYATDVLGSNQWHYITVMWQANSPFQFYVDGILQTIGSFTNGPARISYYQATGTTISDRWNSWNGYLDEVRISDNVLGASWAKLNYETQKPGATAVTVEQP